jgi:hypothetical protein
MYFPHGPQPGSSPDNWIIIMWHTIQNTGQSFHRTLLWGHDGIGGRRGQNPAPKIEPCQTAPLMPSVIEMVPLGIDHILILCPTRKAFAESTDISEGAEPPGLNSSFPSQNRGMASIKLTICCHSDQPRAPECSEIILAIGSGAQSWGRSGLTIKKP